MSKFTNILKIVGATFVLGQGIILGTVGGVLTWKGIDDQQVAKESYTQTQEYIQQKEVEDDRIAVFKDRFDELEASYYRGEISTEAYKEAKKTYQEEMEYTNNKFIEEKLNESDNTELKALYKGGSLEKGFGIALCVLAGLSFIAKASTTIVQNACGEWTYDDGRPWTFTTGGYMIDVIAKNGKEIAEDIKRDRAVRQRQAKEEALESFARESEGKKEEELQSIEDNYYVENDT